MIGDADGRPTDKAEIADESGRTDVPVRFRTLYRNLPIATRAVVVVVGVLVAPVAIPAWTVERVIRRWRPAFEFKVLNSTPYFTGIVLALAAGIIATDALAFQVVALCLLGILELISLSLCLAIAIRIPGRLQFINSFVARRSYGPQVLTAQRSTIYAVIVSAGYAVFFYGILSYVLWRDGPSYFTGVSVHSTQVYIFGQFIQSSFLTITNAGSVLVVQRFAPELIGDLERITGIFFFVYLLSVLASGWAEREHSRSQSDERPEAEGPSRRDPTSL